MARIKLERIHHSALSFAAGLALLVPATVATAQQSHTVFVGVDYTYVRTNILPGCSCVSPQGGGVQAEYSLTPHLALVADLTATHKGGITPDGYNLMQLTYMAGARGFATRSGARLRPFGEFKGGYATALGSLSPANTGYRNNNTGVSFEAGGGLQVRLTNRLTLLPAQADYLMTTFANGQNNRQNDVRLSAGLLFRIR